MEMKKVIDVIMRRDEYSQRPRRSKLSYTPYNIGAWTFELVINLVPSGVSYRRSPYNSVCTHLSCPCCATIHLEETNQMKRKLRYCRYTNDRDLEKHV